MSSRPLLLFSGLTVGDYLLWNWSLSGNHDVIALVSGLSLPPLSVACLWLLAMGVGRLLTRSTGRSAKRANAQRARARTQQRAPATKATAQAPALQDAQPAAAQASPTRRIAA